MNRFKTLKQMPTYDDKKLKHFGTYTCGYGVSDKIESELTTAGIKVSSVKIYTTNGGYIHVYVK